MKITRPTGLSALIALTTSSFGVLACGSVGSEDEPVSLATVGANVTVNLPKGGKLEHTEYGGATVKWVGLSWYGSFELDEAHIEDKATPLAQDPSEIFTRKTPVFIAGKPYTCRAKAKDRADVERIASACATLAAASKAPAASSSRSSEVEKPLELEPRSFSVKTLTGQPLSFSANVPKGWAVSEAGSFVQVKDPAPNSLRALSISFSNYAAVKTTTDAEREVKLLDPGGLETIADSRELSAGKIAVSTAPRGTLKLVTVRVFAGGKAGTVVATCSGPESKRSDLDQVCSSLALE